MMIKRTILGGVLAVLASLWLFGSSATSYFRTSWGYMKDSVQSSVPLEFQIERARRMLKDLTPEVQKNMHLIAREEVEVERLARQVAETQTRLAKEKEEILKLKTDLASGKETFQYGGRKYTLAQVKTDLANRFERYKTSEATLASLQGMHAARQKSVDAARQKLEAMLSARRQLQVDVENLDARRQMVAAAQTTAKYQFDDSELGRVKELVNDLRTRLDVTERLVHTEGCFHDEIPVSESTPENIVDRVSEHFGAAKPQAEALAKATH